MNRHEIPVRKPGLRRRNQKFRVQLRPFHNFQLRLSTRSEHGQDQDWISCRILAIFRIRIGYPFLKKIGSGQNQDIGLISITKFF